MTGRLWQKLRALWGSDERLDSLESAAKAAAERAAALEAALADGRRDLGRQREGAADALAAARAALRDEIGAVASGLKALEDIVSSMELERRRRDTERHAHEAEHQAERAAHEAKTRRLDEQVGALQALRAELEQVRHRVAHQTEQVDILKSRMEVDAALIAEFQEWKASHTLSVRPLVSVCVATYNRAQLLAERCLPSVLGQSYEHLEVVVVGDGCTDETARRVAAIRDPRLRFLNLEHRRDYPADPLRRWMVAGTPALNKALARSRGELITHLDDDDEYLPQRLEKLVGFIRDEACDLVWHPFWYEDHEGRWLLNDAGEFAFAHVTTSSVVYRSWFKKIPWDPEAHLLMEPGDWNRFRRLRFVGPVCRRFPEPLLRHYRERRPAREAESSGSAS